MIRLDASMNSVNCLHLLRIFTDTLIHLHMRTYIISIHMHKLTAINHRDREREREHYITSHDITQNPGSSHDMIYMLDIT